MHCYARTFHKRWQWGLSLRKSLRTAMHCSPFPLKKISSNFLGHPVDLSLLLRSLAEIYLARATVAWVPWMLDLSKGCNWYALSFTSICTWNYKNFLQDPKIPSSRIWTSDLWISIVDNYSPPLYQLSYRGMCTAEGNRARLDATKSSPRWPWLLDATLPIQSHNSPPRGRSSDGRALA